MKYALIATLLLPLAASAGEIKIHTSSYHIAEREWLQQHNSLNEINPGIAYSDGKYEAGIYVNSEYNASVYALHHWPAGPVTLGAGVVGGYKAAPMLPMVGASVRISNVQVGIIAGATREGKPVPVMTFSFVFDN
jgi:hypothetical protein